MKSSLWSNASCSNGACSSLPEKTCITHIEQGSDFLGQNLRRYGGKLLITPSKKNMHAFLEKVRGEIRSNRATKQEYLIRLLNPVIRGSLDLPVLLFHMAVGYHGYGKRTVPSRSKPSRYLHRKLAEHNFNEPHDVYDP
jgi:hypothetical protein